MKTKFLFFFLLLWSRLLFSQSNKAIEDLTAELQKNTTPDTSRVMLLLKISVANYGVNPSNMQLHAEEAIQLSNKLYFKKGQAEGYKLLGAKYVSVGDYQKAEANFQTSLKLFEESKIYSGIIICNNNLGSVALVQNKYPEALFYFQNSIRVAEKSKLPKLAGLAYSNIGIIYTTQKKYDLALKHFQDALTINTTANSTDGMAAGYNNIASVYLDTKNYEKALEFFSKALARDIEMNNKLGMARDYGNLGLVYARQKIFEASFENHSKALKLSEEVGNKKGMAINNAGVGEYYLQKNRLDEALPFMMKSKDIALEIGTRDVLRDAYLGLSDIYEKKGIVDSAYLYFKKYVDIKESIDNENNQKQLARLEIQYEFDNKEEKYKNQQLLDTESLKQGQLLLALNNAKLSVSNKERDLVKLNYLKTQADLKAEQILGISNKKQLSAAENEVKLKKTEVEIANLNLAAKETQKWFYVSGLLLLSIIGGLLFYQRNTSQKANKKLQTLNTELEEANKAKIRFMGILNHDLRSPVASLLQFLQLQQESPDLLDETNKKRLQNKTITSVENLLVSMEDLLLWSKGQMQNFMPFLKKIEIKSIFEDTQRHFESQEHIKINFLSPENLTLHTDENYLKTIIRNLTGNAIGALSLTENPTITWKAWEVQGKKFISVTDNGPGATEDQIKALFNDSEVIGIKSGLGLHLIRDLAKAISCNISVKSNQDEGTTFVLSF
ncbi:tetratricopeptide repeat-containing sensor histidine kinase [Lacihabitans sp. CS3-21]|uniref:tetratricopeptide repeat-containing sensor histidine kinase n=1 Tax=Lacihabitans sp. CS3-21 TaxID=2487332 RepID=UPI0020CD0A60|nr:tetratricopeptide repeat-containing sensor histidine kinase [Lacihabitans sp. CS3-21]MCP9745112.1 tetratricopeptide repeat protein [Lacihabitans sp. CS3-21]